MKNGNHYKHPNNNKKHFFSPGTNMRTWCLTSVWLSWQAVVNERVRTKVCRFWQFSAEKSDPNLVIQRNTSCSSCYHHRKSLHFFNFRLYFIILIVGQRNTTFITRQWYHTALTSRDTKSISSSQGRTCSSVENSSWQDQHSETSIQSFRFDYPRLPQSQMVCEKQLLFIRRIFETTISKYLENIIHTWILTSLN